ncbi:MAG TPA: DUF4386 domain-containing protein [Gemmatimonadaceae bacterium]|nr:DUF4386 domain-containing protein [Gemmatimonadaceae bacterium]
MSAIFPLHSTTDMSPRTKGRFAGAVYLLYVIAGVYAQAFVSERFIVFSDAAKTASNILANQSLYRLGFTVYLLEMAGQIATVVLFYQLLKPVSRTGAMLAAAFELTGCGIKIFSRLFYFVPLLVLSGAGGGSAASSLSVFSKEQIDSIALLMLRINDNGAAIALAFFGFSTALQGWLIYNSGFLPRWLGVIGIIGGLGWLTFLSPPLGMRLFTYIALYALIGLAATIGWLLTVGVDDQRWRQRAARASSSIWT